MRKTRWTIWRLYPDAQQSALFIRVLIFDRRGDLIRFWRECGSSHAEAHGTAARCQEVVAYRVGDDGARKKLPLIATVSLWRAQMSVGIVAHELFHATAAWARRVGLDLANISRDDSHGVLPEDAVEEQMATIHGRLVSQFVIRANHAGYYGNERRTTR